MQFNSLVPTPFYHVDYNEIKHDHRGRTQGWELGVIFYENVVGGVGIFLVLEPLKSVNKHGSYKRLLSQLSKFPLKPS